MERKAFQKVIELMAKEIENLEQELSFEKTMSKFRADEVTKLQAENKRLNELLTPLVTKGEENE